MTALRDSCQAVLGTPSPIRAFPGSTDASNFNCPTVICGPSNLAQCHSLNEYISVDEIEAAVKIYFKTIIAIQNI
jgi:acetylornithine deacetylase